VTNRSTRQLPAFSQGYRRGSVTIGRLFNTLLFRTHPSAADLTRIASHRYTVTRRLKSAFTTNKVETIGSFCRQSMVRGSSDIDLLLVLNANELRWGGRIKDSDTVLNAVRVDLQDRYTNTEVGRDGQAITIYFNDGQYPVDVVPAFYRGPGANNYPIYYIPDGDGGWMVASPQIHNKYISDQDRRSGGKLKNVAKLLKFWRSCRTSSIPLNSFHVEILLAQHELCIGPKSYAQCLADAFTLLSGRQSRAIQDPNNVSGLIKSANTEAKLQVVNSSVSASAEQSRRALAAEDEGNIQEAFRQWNMVFNDNFPRS